jgi:hypothetical protein
LLSFHIGKESEEERARLITCILRSH